MKTKIISILAVVAIFATMLLGCDDIKEDPIPREEAQIVLSSLMENVAELNRIHYGEGLLHIELGEDDVNLYAVMSPEEDYKSLSEIEALTRKTLTRAYSDQLLKDTLEGYTDGSKIIQPRYIEYGEKILVFKEIESLEGIYTYDLTTIEVTDTTAYVIEGTVKTTTGQTKRLKAVLESDGWRLSSTIY